MKYPATTGAVAEALSVSEPRLNDLIRRGKIHPAPRVSGGRRFWEHEHFVQAALLLGIAVTTCEEGEADSGG